MSDNNSSTENTNKNNLNKKNKSCNKNLLRNFILLCLIVIFLYLVYELIYRTNFEGLNNNSKKIKKNKEKKESYKPDRARSDPYDDYDLKSDINQLLKKQEDYLTKNVNSI